jgi:hypothetical protein
VLVYKVFVFKVVFVFTNGRLADKMVSSEEGFIGWDEEEQMEGDDVASDGAGDT